MLSNNSIKLYFNIVSSKWKQKLPESYRANVVKPLLQVNHKKIRLDSMLPECNLVKIVESCYADLRKKIDLRLIDLNFDRISVKSQKAKKPPFFQENFEKSRVHTFWCEIGYFKNFIIDKATFLGPKISLSSLFLKSTFCYLFQSGKKEFKFIPL